MNASDYIDSQLEAKPNQGVSAADYLDQQTSAQPIKDNQGLLHNLMDIANAPINGLDNAFANTAIGTVQGGSALAHKMGLMGDDTLANIRTQQRVNFNCMHSSACC